MRLRVGFLLTCAAGALLIGAGPTTSTAADQSAMPVKAMPAADPIPYWWFHGELEVGGRAFLNNPERNGVNSAGGKSLAKYYEYSTIKPGAFADGHLSTGTSNGLYQIDLWAKNVGYSDQSYQADLSKAGEHYLTLGWDQTPHIYSTSAQTIYNGVGTNALTLPAGLSNSLFVASGNHYGGVGGLAFTPANASAVQTLINANRQQTDIGIRRDTASVEYRWTPTTAWDIKTDYTDMKRTGTQADSATFSWGTNGVRVDTTKPVNDRTQNYGVGGEYAGTSPWGKNFNLKIAYNGSTYSEGNESYTIENPFCPTGAVANGCARGGGGGTALTSSPLALMSLPPDNQANAVSGTLGADLPFKSRYMGTVTYNMMRQNQAFQPFTITPGLLLSNGAPANLLSSLPAASLNGAINTLMVNNVVTTQITSDLKSKLSYRYYNVDNNTPQLLESANFVGADTTSPTTYLNPRSAQASYTKDNVGAELTWRATRQLNLGAAYGYERYDRSLADVGVTNENSGKVYGDWKPANWAMARASYTYSSRRFEGTYDNLNNVVVNMFPGALGTTNVSTNQAYRNFMYSDRDSNKAKFSLAVDVVPMVTLTPNGGLKYDNYLNNVTLGSLTTTCSGASCVAAGTYNGIPLNGTQLGLKNDNSWNLGLEASVVVTPVTTFLLSYTREYGDKDLFWCTNAAVSSTTACNAFSSGATGTGFPTGSNEARMKDTVDTFILRMRHEAIPNKLDFDVGYTLSIANGSTSFNPGPIATYGTAAAGNFPLGTVAVAGGPFPDTKTTFQRFDVITTYKLERDMIQRLGYKGDVALKLRYAYESNRVTNWQIDSMQTYMYSANNLTIPYQIWLAGNNPNYDVHLVSAALAFKW
jgi:MtrB/PioB family decaheme-associated outer membrane protein